MKKQDEKSTSEPYYSYKKYSERNIVPEDSPAATKSAIPEIQDDGEHLPLQIKELNDALLKAENEAQIFRTLSEFSPAGIYHTDEAGMFDYVNRQWCVMSGLTPGRSKGDGWMKSLHPLDRKGVERSWKDLIRDGGKLEMEYRFQDRKGNIRWVHDNVSPVRTKTGLITGFVGTTMDITSHIEVTNAFRESEKKYRLLFNKMIEGLVLLEIITDENGKPADYIIRRVNPAFEKISGYGAESLPGKRLSALIPEFCRRMMARINEVITKRENVDSEVFIPDNGHYYKIRTFFYKKNAIGAVVEDISMAVHSRNLLKKNEEKYRLLLEESNALICELDENGIFRYVSPQFIQKLGYTKSFLMNHSIVKILQGDMKEEFLVKLAAFSAGTGIQRGEFQVRGTSAEWMWFSYILSSYRDRKKRKHISMLNFDITEKKASEARLQKNAAELIELNNTKDRFFRIIAHDLRNPFNGLIGASDLLLEAADESDADSIKRLSRIIYESASSGFALLNNLLEWSKAQTGSIGFEPEDIEIREVVTECFSQLRTLTDSKHINIDEVISSGYIIYADRYLLSSILRNLISNAIKFTLPGGSVSLKAEGNEKEVSISVRDTGVGIPSHILADLFRIDKAFSTPGTGNEKGTGLGLLLCNEFVNMHGGRIRVESEPGQGSVFTITLPTKGT